MPLPKKPIGKRTVFTYDNIIATVPDASIAEAYEGRIINGQRDFAIFDMARATGMNILLEGPTGAGKTMACQAYAAPRPADGWPGIPFYAIPCNAGVPPEELIGSFIPDPVTGQFVFVPGGLADVIEHGGLVLINEINFLPERIAAIMFEALDGRRSVTLKHVRDAKKHVIRAHRPNCWCNLPEDECKKKWVLIVADMNPGYSGTKALNSALRNRFAIKLEWDYDPKVEAKLVALPTLLGIARQARDATKKTMEYTEPIGTNLLMEFQIVALTLGLDMAIGNMVAAMVVPEERTALRQVFRTHRSSLEKDLAALALSLDETIDPLTLDDEPEEQDVRNQTEDWGNDDWGKD